MYPQLSYVGYLIFLCNLIVTNCYANVKYIITCLGSTYSIRWISSSIKGPPILSLDIYQGETINLVDRGNLKERFFKHDTSTAFFLLSHTFEQDDWLKFILSLLPLYSLESNLCLWSYKSSSTSPSVSCASCKLLMKLLEPACSFFFNFFTLQNEKFI